MNKEEEIKKSFLYFYSQKRYAQALLLASKYNFLQELEEYQKLYEHFLQRLQLAVRYIKKGSEEKAKQIIDEFALIEEKRHFIKLLLEYKEEFLAFLSYASSGAVIEAYEIAQKDPRYKKLSIYTDVIQKIERVLQRVDVSLNSMLLDVEDILVQMQSYPNSKVLFRKLHKVKQLKSLYEVKKIKECYELLEKEVVLEQTSLAKELHRRWYESKEKAKLFAKDGDIEMMLKSLGVFLQIQVKEKEILPIIKKGFRSEIENLLDQRKYEKAEKKIYGYLEKFGKDVLFAEVMERFEKESQKRLAILHEYGKEEQWREKLLGSFKS